MKNNSQRRSEKGKENIHTVPRSRRRRRKKNGAEEEEDEISKSKFKKRIRIMKNRNDLLNNLSTFTQSIDSLHFSHEKKKKKTKNF